MIGMLGGARSAGVDAALSRLLGETVVFLFSNTYRTRP